MESGRSPLGHVDSEIRALLQTFDANELNAEADPRRVLALDVLSRRLSAAPAALRALAEELVARGWLARASANSVIDGYTRTEDGRLAIARPFDVTLYTRPGCHLCEDAKSQIAPLLRRASASLREVNIDADPVLRLRYDVDVPVILLGSRKVAKHRVDLRQFERQLEEARRPLTNIAV